MIQNINSASFLPLIDSPNGLPKLKVVDSTVFEIMGGGSAEPPLFLRRRCGHQIPSYRKG